MSERALDHGTAVPETAVGFSAYGGRIRVRANDTELADWVRGSLPPAGRLDGRGEPDLTYRAIRSPDGGPNRLWAEDDLLLETRDPVEFRDRLERELHFAAAASARDRVFIHAGVVRVGDEIVLLPGRSRVGKSFLVAALLDAGAVYLSDEYAVVDRRGRIHPFPRDLRLRGPEGPEVRSPEELGAEVATTPGPASRILVTHHRPGARWRPAELGRADALLELFANSVTARTRSSLVMSALRQVVEEAVAHRGVRGEARQIVEWLGLSAGTRESTEKERFK